MAEINYVFGLVCHDRELRPYFFTGADLEGWGGGEIGYDPSVSKLITHKNTVKSNTCNCTFKIVYHMKIIL